MVRPKKALITLLTLFLTSLLAVFLIVAISGCSNENQADQKQRQATANLMEEAHKEVGMPDINSFQERKFFKQILEQRDQAFGTYTYTRNLQGRPVLVCESVGYGLPASTQYTNPERSAWIHPNSAVGRGSIGKLPQPDPNGLFMPTSSSATYVLCTDPDASGGYDAQYVEQEITVVTKPLRGAITRWRLDTSAPAPVASIDTTSQ